MQQEIEINRQNDSEARRLASDDSLYALQRAFSTSASSTSANTYLLQLLSPVASATKQDGLPALCVAHIPTIMVRIKSGIQQR